MIYTRFGSPVKFTAARVEQVKVKRFGKREEIPCYQVKAVYAGPHQDGQDSTGKMLCDGAWVDAVEFKADKGWSEICDQMEALGVNLRG